METIDLAKFSVGQRVAYKGMPKPDYPVGSPGIPRIDGMIVARVFKAGGTGHWRVEAVTENQYADHRITRMDASESMFEHEEQRYIAGPGRELCVVYPSGRVDAIRHSDPSVY
jgi:hypothetical protein